jgi:ubiquinone/menaquinone biosynthesis C-methylase UbiE
MIRLTNLKGDEKILDLGTGAGFIAIGFAKKLHSGHVYGIDKYHAITDGVFSRFWDEMKINFFGNTIINAERNAHLESQQKKVTFLQGDLTKQFPFSDNEFDIVVCSQFLYCIPDQLLQKVLKETDRILQPLGTIVFFESNRYLQWDIQGVFDFFIDKGYDVELYTVEEMSNKCYLYGKKPGINQ